MADSKKSNGNKPPDNETSSQEAWERIKPPIVGSRTLRSIYDEELQRRQPDLTPQQRHERIGKFLGSPGAVDAETVDEWDDTAERERQLERDLRKRDAAGAPPVEPEPAPIVRDAEMAHRLAQIRLYSESVAKFAAAGNEDDTYRAAARGALELAQYFMGAAHTLLDAKAPEALRAHEARRVARVRREWSGAALKDDAMQAFIRGVKQASNVSDAIADQRRKQCEEYLKKNRPDLEPLERSREVERLVRERPEAFVPRAENDTLLVDATGYVIRALANYHEDAKAIDREALVRALRVWHIKTPGNPGDGQKGKYGHLADAIAHTSFACQRGALEQAFKNARRRRPSKSKSKK
jgi:hypothetical protein